MVWKPTLVFLALVAVSHALDPRLIRQPLSVTRDGRYPVVGYAAFAALLWACWRHVRVYTTASRDEQGNIFGPFFASVLLLVVAVTPTYHDLHICTSCGLLVWVFLFFAAKLVAENSWWIFAYVAVPVVVTLFVTSFGLGYGVWQKSVILFYLAAMNVDAWQVKDRSRHP